VPRVAEPGGPSPWIAEPPSPEPRVTPGPAVPLPSDAGPMAPGRIEPAPNTSAPLPGEPAPQAPLAPAPRTAGPDAAMLPDVRILDGNIGYMAVNAMPPSETAMQAVAAAFALLDRTDALILDLRGNTGGSPAIVGLIEGYLSEGPSYTTNTVHWRNDDRPERLRTADVGERAYGSQKPVYVLTSQTTFSAAEQLSYDLQAFKRATIVGETTGGGSHTSNIGPVPLGHGFVANIPTGYLVNAVTGTNWEGTGVKPDVAVPAEEASGCGLVAGGADAGGKRRRPGRPRMAGSVRRREIERRPRSRGRRSGGRVCAGSGRRPRHAGDDSRGRRRAAHPDAGRLRRPGRRPRARRRQPLRAGRLPERLLLRLRQAAGRHPAARVRSRTADRSRQVAVLFRRQSASGAFAGNERSADHESIRRQAPARAVHDT